MKQTAQTITQESLRVKEAFADECLDDVVAITEAMTAVLRAGGKVLVFGNGGSAADSQHLAGELVGRFRRERRALPCVALTTDTSVITAWTNDYDYESLFSRQVEALAAAGDLVIGISTSGNSVSVLNGIAAARERGAKTVGMSGAGGGKLREACDLCLCAPSDQTPRVQECHELAIHIICELVESALFDQ